VRCVWNASKTDIRTITYRVPPMPVSEGSFGLRIIARRVRDMGRESWQQERDELQAVFDDLRSGMIRLERGQDEYLASLQRRIAYLDAKLSGDASPDFASDL
jgi:hypothetical protein